MCEYALYVQGTRKGKLVLAIVDFKINDRSRHTHKSIFRFAHVDKSGQVQIFC